MREEIIDLFCGTENNGHCQSSKNCPNFPVMRNNKIKISEIKQRGENLLHLDPSPPAKLRLLRDVLKVSPRNPELRSTVADLNHSKQVRILLKELREDGGWGAFHSRSSRSKVKISSTEVGVERALNLGLDKDHDGLKKVKNYLLSLIEGKINFPDYYEKNDRWETGMRLFLASTLSFIDPDNRELNEDRNLWREIAIRTFKSGDYSEREEIKAHRELTGASVKDSYLKINNRYSLNILGTKKKLLPFKIEQALLEWLGSIEEGIGYLEMPLSRKPPLNKPGPIDRWFTSLELISRSKFHPPSYFIDQLNWIWQQQDSDGLWDFGPRSASSTFHPLADSWRIKKNRKIDWSIRVLILLSPEILS